MEWGPEMATWPPAFSAICSGSTRPVRSIPRVRYVLVDSQASALEQARTHPDLAPHLSKVDSLCADVTDLATVAAGTVDRILCNELWNELTTKLIVKKGGEYEEKHLRPNLNERTAAARLPMVWVCSRVRCQDIEK